MQPFVKAVSAFGQRIANAIAQSRLASACARMARQAADRAFSHDFQGAALIVGGAIILACGWGVAALGLALLAAGCLVHIGGKAAGMVDTETSRIRLLGERFERGIERLKDMQWQLRDDEARYRDLLDSQSDLITRTDAEGRLTFVNRAFCRTFGAEAGALLGTAFRYDVVQGELPAVNAVLPAQARQRTEALILTRDGARWFVFECSAVTEADGSSTGMQTSSVAPG